MIRAATSILILLFFTITVTAQSSAFNFQGRLNDGSEPANGRYDLQFKLFDAIAGGNQVGATIDKPNTILVNGVFSTTLDFGGTAFIGGNRFVEISVRPFGSPDPHVILGARQQVMSVPFAITAGNVSGVVQIANGGTGSATQNFVDLTTDQNIGGNKTFTGVISGNGAGLTNVNATVADGSITTAKIADGAVTQEKLAADITQNSRSLSLLGQKRWDLLNQRIPVSGALGMAFDGASVWVVSGDIVGGNNNSVTRIRASDGTILATYPLPSGWTPTGGIAFDGANIWISHRATFSVVRKLRASDGALIGTFSVGQNPGAIAFDGANIWVACRDDDAVRKLRASDGVPLGTFPVGTYPTDLAFDGKAIWVVNQGSNTVMAIRNDTIDTTLPFSGGPTGIAVDGANIWVIRPGYLQRWNIATGLPNGSLPNLPTGEFTQNVVFDGANIWTRTSAGLIKIRATDMVVVGHFRASGSFTVSRDVAFDGANIWIIDDVFGQREVVKFPVFR